jgi:hypothetical protein
MLSADYTFFLNNLKINSKMSNGPYVDKDWIVFWVSLNGTSFLANACAALGGTEPQQTAAANPFYVDGYIGLAKSGDDLLLCDQPPSAGPFPNGTVPPATDLTDGWVVGPLSIADDDAVTVNYVITNLSYVDPSQMAADGLKIGGAVLAAAGGALSLVTSGIAGIIGGILNGIAQLLAGIIGSDQQNCNGAVAISPDLVFTGAQLETMVNAPVPDQQNITLFTTTIVNSGLSEPSPGGCGSPDTDVMWSIQRDISPQDVFPSQPPSAPGQLRPLAASLSTQDWAGTWGDSEFINNSRIICTIGASGSGVTGASDAERASSYGAGLLDSIENEPATASLLGRDPRVARGGALAIASVPAAPRAMSAGTAPVIPVTARYSADITEHLGSAGGQVAEQMEVSNLAEIPMVALRFAGDVYAPIMPVEEPVRSVLGAETPRATPAAGRPASVKNPITMPDSTGGASAADHGDVIASSAPATGRQDTLISLTYAATLVASNDVSLQLYGLVGATGQITEHRIRYLRKSDSGNIVTDVMLSAVQQEPS